MRALTLAALTLTPLLTTGPTGLSVDAGRRDGPPTQDPAAAYRLAWTGAVRWANVISIEAVPGGSPDERFRAAQERVAAAGGGVVFFPAGTYEFTDHLQLKSGVVIRGANPGAVTDARQDGYDPPTRFVFLRYVPKHEGQGTPIATAFKGVTLADPAAAGRCGVVHVAIDRGHIDFPDDGTPEHRCGRERLVLGCVLRHAAVADPSVPDVQAGQHPWQRFTARHRAAVSVKGENLLVANNRLPLSGGENFTMKGYVVRGRNKQPHVIDEVVFDYDNRPGLSVNDYGVGAAGGNPPDGTPETHPWGFRQGIVIRDNFIASTGRCAISFCGDGVVCADNVIRFRRDVDRPTVTGRDLTAGSGTNDNRAVQMRGWRWTVSGNDYEVHRNRSANRAYYLNDGEGLMHEDHVNSTVRDSKLLRNRGNAYLSIYKTGGVDGLLIEGNDVRTPGGIAAVYVVADRNSGRHPCKNVQVVGNTTAGGGIHIAGEPAENNVLKGNKHLGGTGKLINHARATLEGNEGYEVVNK